MDVISRQNKRKEQWQRSNRFHRASDSYRGDNRTEEKVALRKEECRTDMEREAKDRMNRDKESERERKQWQKEETAGRVAMNQQKQKKAQAVVRRHDAWVASQHSKDT